MLGATMVSDCVNSDPSPGGVWTTQYGCVHNARDINWVVVHAKWRDQSDSAII